MSSAPTYPYWFGLFWWYPHCGAIVVSIINNFPINYIKSDNYIGIIIQFYLLKEDINIITRCFSIFQITSNIRNIKKYKIGSAFYGNMDDKNLYQCMVDSKLKDKFDNINCFHYDEKYISKGVPKYISNKCHFKQEILEVDLYPTNVKVYNVYNDNIIHTFHCCNINKNNMYLMNMIDTMINNNEYKSVYYH